MSIQYESDTHTHTDAKLPNENATIPIFSNKHNNTHWIHLLRFLLLFLYYYYSFQFVNHFFFRLMFRFRHHLIIWTIISVIVFMYKIYWCVCARGHEYESSFKRSKNDWKLDWTTTTTAADRPGRQAGTWAAMIQRVFWLAN